MTSTVDNRLRIEVVMSSKTRTRKTRVTGTTGSARTLQPIPCQDTAAKVRTDTEDKLWKALHANPNSTAADLASVAKIGKSTAGKILAKWQKDGSVTRTAGIAQGGGRAADLWAITDTDTGVDTEPTDQTPTDDTPTDDISASDAASADRAQPDPTAPDTTTADTTADDATLSDTQPADADSTETTNTAKAEPRIEAITPAADSAATDSDTATEGSDGDSKKARLAPGSLHGMVEDYLRDHPGEEFGPTAIAKGLGGKSSGAVSNALDKLVADGTAVKTNESPKRFVLAPAE
jgi:hypothetical protein